MPLEFEVAAPNYFKRRRWAPRKIDGFCDVSGSAYCLLSLRFHNLSAGSLGLSAGRIAFRVRGVEVEVT